MRVLVCGGRTYADRTYLHTALDDLHRARGPFTRLIQGAAPGADTLAGQWAESRGIPVAAYPAAWAVHGRAAGPLRNQQMLEEGRPELVVAFPGGRGTADMTRRARKAGVEVIEVAAD